MSSPDQKALRDALDALQIEHRKLDAEIVRLQEEEMVNQLEVTRLKKRKLKLKDEISRLEDQILPDIIA